MRANHFFLLLSVSTLGAGCLPGIAIDGGPGQQLGEGCRGYQPGASSVAEEAVARLNCYRRLMGLGAVVHDPQLAIAARAHAEYMDATSEYGHAQTQTGHPLFRGAWPEDRVQDAGFSYDGSMVGIHEVVAFHDVGADPTRAVDLWMDTVYHREPLSTPELEAVGFGAAGIYSVMEVVAPWEADDEASFAVYPAAGQGDARPTFDSDTETPDPAPSHGVVGVPITLTALAPLWLGDGDPYGMRMDRGRTSVRSLGGVEQQLLFLEPATQPTLLRTAAVVPAEPLPPHSTWDVTFVFTLGGVEYERSWSFATGDEPTE